MFKQLLDLGFLGLVQYRQKVGGGDWKNMAAFDVNGAAESYFQKQDTSENWPWEYRLIDLEEPAHD